MHFLARVHSLAQWILLFASNRVSGPPVTPPFLNAVCSPDGKIVHSLAILVEVTSIILFNRIVVMHIMLQLCD
jgi:hypothetical protein